MKIRFPMKNTGGINGCGSPQCLGLDTAEIIAFQLSGTNADVLHLWYRGTPDSVVITEKEIGADYFADLLTLICGDFQHIDDAKSGISLLSEMRPLNPK